MRLATMAIPSMGCAPCRSSRTAVAGPSNQSGGLPQSLTRRPYRESRRFQARPPMVDTVADGDRQRTRKLSAVRIELNRQLPRRSQRRHGCCVGLGASQSRNAERTRSTSQSSSRMGGALRAIDRAAEPGPLRLSDESGVRRGGRCRSPGRLWRSFGAPLAASPRLAPLSKRVDDRPQRTLTRNRSGVSISDDQTDRH
jgi:hypothetical protein